jgi:hypothetical protein
VVAANEAGRVDPTPLAAAQGFDRQMTTPAPGILPAPADAAHVAAVEARMGVRLPFALRRVYGDVADGGFGPGEGLLPLAEVARQYEALRASGAMPRGRSWPDGMLPLVSMDPGWDCVEAATGRVIAWDPDELAERSGEAVFARSFRVIRPSVEAWLTDWVGSRTQAEVMDAQMHAMREDGGRTHIRALQAMTAEQREAMGLGPGWEADMAATMGITWPPPGEEP